MNLQSLTFTNGVFPQNSKNIMAKNGKNLLCGPVETFKKQNLTNRLSSRYGFLEPPLEVVLTCYFSVSPFSHHCGNTWFPINRYHLWSSFDLLFFCISVFPSLWKHLVSDIPIQPEVRSLLKFHSHVLFLYPQVVQMAGQYYRYD